MWLIQYEAQARSKVSTRTAVERNTAQGPLIAASEFGSRFKINGLTTTSNVVETVLIYAGLVSDSETLAKLRTKFSDLLKIPPL
jgi:hypothetical protein